MSITIQNQLDPLFETVILLFVGYDLNNLKDTVVSQLNELGGDGESIFYKYLKDFEKYIHNFQKKRIVSKEDEFYFKDTSLELFNALVAPFLIDRGLLDSIGGMNNSQIREILFQNSEEIFGRNIKDYCGEEYEDFWKTEDITKFINSTDFNESDKWKIFLVLQNPHDYYNNLASMIKSNIPAYEYAIETIRSSFEKYLKQFSKDFSGDIKVEQFHVGNILKDSTIKVVIPSMAVGIGVIIGLSDTCYYGLLVEKVFEEIGKKNNSKDYIISCLKALSDNSKLEILISLKVSPKYATELAEQLGLTSATVSHHMNTLLTYNMVYLEKENGKYYYYVNDTTLKDILEQLRLLIL